MPELPEVETIVRELAGAVTGRRIEDVRVLDARMLRADPKPFIKGLKGKTVLSVGRHGKAVFLRLGASASSAPEAVLRVHLGMTGQLLFVPPDTAPAKHTHIVFRFDAGPYELHHRDMRRFGRLRVLPREDAPLAPDAWTDLPETVYRALRKRRGMLKHALMNQNVVAGMGNIYVDESLHRAKLHPERRLETVRDASLRKLVTCMREVLAESINVGGTSFRNYLNTAGSRGGFKRRLSVYGRNGKPCACGETIRKKVVAGRGTHFCPRCQPPPRSSLRGGWRPTKQPRGR